MSEQKRGCGFRSIFGLYLVTDPGFQLICDGLPLPLEPCGCCGFEPPFSRNLQKIHPDYISQAGQTMHDSELPPEEGGFLNCRCPPICPICHPDRHPVFGLMFVGKQSYTPSSFIREAFTMGVSKRIPEIPSWLKLNETWILLAHLKVPKLSLEEMKANELHSREPEYHRAIFYAFKPQRVEMPVWKGDLTDEQIRKLEEKGITPVLLEPTPESTKKHKFAKGGGRILDKYLEEEHKE